MKHTYNIIFAILLCLVIASCGSEKKQKFAPQDRTTSKMSIEERDAAIAAKRQALGVSLDTLLYSHGVRFAIVQPKIQGDVTQDIADRLSVKMLQIAVQNGISGVGSCNFVMGAECTQTGRAATGTAPQKMTVNYELTFKVLNTTTGDVYATATQDVMGVGRSFEEANRNAVNEVKNTPQLQKMLQTASTRIVEWYNGNVHVVKNQIEKAAGEGNYDLALSLLHSIPEQATVAYRLVGEKQESLLKGMLHKRAADMLAEMEGVMASSGEEFNPAVGAYFSLIPTDCPEHATAQKLYAEYEKKCHARRDALEAKAERDEQAARELEKLKMLYEHEKEIAEIEADKIKAKYEAQASAKQFELMAKKNSSGGDGPGINKVLGSLFGAMGNAINGKYERIFKVADVAGRFLTDKLDLEEYTKEPED